MTEAIATFNSADPKLRLVRTPTRRKMNERGEWETERGTTYTFNRGALKVTQEMEEKDPGLLEWLRKHKSLGTFFFEPQRPQPSRVGEDSSEVLKEILRLASKGDGDAIADIWVAERNDQSRPEVIAACEEAIQLVDGAEEPEPEDRPVHEERYPNRPPGPHKGPRPGEEGTPEVEEELEPRHSAAAEKLAEEHGVSLREIEGTGKDGRVTKPDVEAFIERRSQMTETDSGQTQTAPVTSAEPAATEEPPVIEDPEEGDGENTAPGPEPTPENFTPEEPEDFEDFELEPQSRPEDENE